MDAEVFVFLQAGVPLLPLALPLPFASPSLALYPLLSQDLTGILGLTGEGNCQKQTKRRLIKQFSSKNKSNYSDSSKTYSIANYKFPGITQTHNLGNVIILGCHTSRVILGSKSNYK